MASVVSIVVTASASAALAAFRLIRSAISGLARSAASNAAPMALMAGKILAVVAAAATLTGVLGNLLGGVQLLAPAAAAGGLALLGLKLAMNGVQDALDAGLSGDTEAFEKALKKLAPSAANAVRTIVKIRDEWKPLAKDFQGRVFEGAAGELSSLNKLIKPVADVWLPRLAMRFAETRNQLADVASAFVASGKFEGVWRNIHAAVSSLLDVLKPLAQAFLNVLEVAAPKFAQLSDNIRQLAVAFGDWIQKSKDSGKLTEWLNKAWETGAKLWEIVKNLGTALAGIFKASSGGGDSFLDNLVSWTEELSTWVNSGDGQKLISIFSEVISFLSQSAPVFGLILDYLSVMVTWWGFLKDAAIAAWDGIVAAAKFAIMWILNGYGLLVNGAAKAFGWMPGIGDKLKAAAASFNAFKDQVNNSLNGINKTIDITVNYRARMIGNHLVSGAQQSGSYSSGIGGRASGGIASGLTWVGEGGRPELVDFSQGRVHSSAKSAAMARQAGSGSGATVVIAPADNSDAALANALLKVLRVVIRNDFGGDSQAALGRA